MYIGYDKYTNFPFFVLGLFDSSNMPYELQRDKGPKGEPSLPEMTRKAIQILQKNSKGYFLLVEGNLWAFLRRFFFFLQTNIEWKITVE